jgi:hypothetical protein
LEIKSAITSEMVSIVPNIAPKMNADIHTAVMAIFIKVLSEVFMTSPLSKN